MTLLCTLKFLLKDSYAYYGGSNELPILSTKIGNFSGGERLPEKATGADFSTQIYLQDQSDDKKYNLVNKIPIYGFKINETKSNCTPEDSVYSNYGLNDNKLTINIKETKARQVVCRLYYDTDPTADGTVYALIQDDEYGTVKYGEDLYRFANIISDDTYDMVGYECTNSNSETTVTYENNKIKVITEKPNVCYVYFKTK